MSNYTKGPWVQFVMDGQCHAIMPAGRPGDVCSFELPPTDADARLMTAAPDMLAALQKAMEWADGLRYGAEPGTTLVTALEQMRAAITKAVTP